MYTHDHPCFISNRSFHLPHSSPTIRCSESIKGDDDGDNAIDLAELKSKLPKDKQITQEAKLRFFKREDLNGTTLPIVQRQILKLVDTGFLVKMVGHTDNSRELQYSPFGMERSVPTHRLWLTHNFDSVTRVRRLAAGTTSITASGTSFSTGTTQD